MPSAFFDDAVLNPGALQRAIFNSANFSSIATDARGVIQIFNVGAERMLGYAAADVMNKMTPADISDPQEVIARAEALSVEFSTPITPGFEALVLKASRGIEDIYELTYIRKDGSRFPAVVSVTALRDPEDTIIGYLLIGTDNTAREQAKAQLHLQGAALNAAANAIVITDDVGVIEWVNPAFSDLTGYTAAEAVGKNPRDLVKSDHHDRSFYKNLWDTILSGHVWRGETINRHKDGSLYTEEQTITPVRNSQGEIRHFIAVKQDITERKRAEEEIRKGAELSARAEREFRTLFASNPLPMWIYDLTTLQFLAVNNAAVERYGYERAEFLAMTIKDIRPPEDVERLLKDVSQPRPQWQSAGNWHHRLKSGQIIDVDITSHTITFAGESAALVVAQDITQRKRAEEDVRRRAQLSALGATVGLSLTEADSLAHALHQCADALVTHLGAAFARIWTLNEGDGVLELQASAGLYTHLNGPHGKVSLGQFKIGRIAQNRTPHLTNTVIGDPEVNDQEWARREGMVAFAGYPLMVESRVVGVMALFARHALSDAVISALASVADHIALGIERHRSAEALGIAEERMRFALEAAGVGIWDMDYTTGVLRWSTILEAQYGLRPGTFDGTFEALVERIHPDDRESALGIIGKAMKSGGDFQRQSRALWPDGTVRWLSGAGRILLGEHGEPVRGVGISIDVTERQTLEEQFLQAQKMEAIGRLAGGVAHDFNNLLTVILGFCELLLANVDPDDPRQADIIEIQKAGTRAAGFTRQLLAFSRKEIIEPTRLDLNEVMANMRVMLGRLIGEDVTVALGLGPELAFVTADRGQVEQIVLNLAVNARDAMPKGGTLTIETANVELDEHYAQTHVAVKPGPYVALTVTDTGTGMTPQVQARLFEPFFTTKEPGKGTGLGLATVQDVVARSGGSVTVSSEVGRGTSFTVYFPRAAAAMVIEPPKPIAQLPAGAQTVLVVEDEDALRALAKRLLERQGYTVLVASNADEALELFEGNPSIDVLLTDVVMPGTSGAELTRQLMERRPALKVLYMSGYTEDAISQHGVLKPGIALLHKPFTSDTLGRKIREVLDR
jgi:two-component system cell cycle sensor histidine kinase/response regulator CckA